MSKLLSAVQKLQDYHRQGLLQGDVMPEDANPGFDPASEEALRYFTLPMALNFQRNSYSLWKSALATYEDTETRFVFDPDKVMQRAPDDVQKALLKYKVALQPNKHPAIWMTLCRTIEEGYKGSFLSFFKTHAYDVEKIKRILETEKKKFPYLAGPKISNYWLYVLSQYTKLPLKNLQALSIAPDTHVIQASVQLGLVPHGSSSLAVAEAWTKALANTDISPIQVHTPLWLWSRQNFQPEV